MTHAEELIERLRPIAARIVHWRSEAERIKALATDTLETKAVEDDRLQEVEQIAGQIYKEIEDFDALVAEVSDESPQAAAQLAEVGNALQLILLEITELGTSMYSVRSGLPMENPAL
jgi:peptidoglycan hydrolase CwlO-like protein